MTQSITTRLQSCGLLRSQGLIGGKLIDAYDGKTIMVLLKGFCVDAFNNIYWVC